MDSVEWRRHITTRNNKCTKVQGRTGNVKERLIFQMPGAPKPAAQGSGSAPLFLVLAISF